MESATFSEYAGLMACHSLTSTTEPAPDSATLDSQRGPLLQTPYPAVAYAPHTAAELRDFLVRLARESGGAMLASLPVVAEPTLYTLTAALYLFSRGPDNLLESTLISAGFHPDAEGIDAESNWPARLLTDLQAELRWRDCRGMGQDPMGGVRRGRLLQLVASFVELTTPGASSLHRHKLVGRCPLCTVDESLQVFLNHVRWRCFACNRAGGLLEFAEALLDAVAA